MKKGMKRMDNHYYYSVIQKGINMYWRTLARARGLTLHNDNEGVEWVSSNDEDGPAMIFNILIDSNDRDKKVNDLIEKMVEGSLPPNILITPCSAPENLAHNLVSNGFKLDDASLCMVMDLKEQSQEIADQWVDVMKVTDEMMLKKWVDIINVALFGIEIMSFEQFYDIFSADNVCLTLATYKGIPATVCMTITDGDIGTIEFVATLKEYRKKGLGTTILKAALKDLEEKGIKSATLRAAPDGISLYKKLGFIEYCKRIMVSVK
ncbi:GNAT family N-acetyltransferase [Vallitalea okinawensis]|uniref:GNAT family N-acetyltransferase n=1 Tax=Vallitalea okinawensis TaxID=2078660 RepID=UPI000CFC1BF8|nr:GNAT family N-acetyltransferase [Vallitalea okinawensis]